MSFTYTTLSKASKLLTDIASFDSDAIITVRSEGLTYKCSDYGLDYFMYFAKDDTDGKLVCADNLVSISASAEELAEAIRKLTDDWEMEIISEKEV